MKEFIANLDTNAIITIACIALIVGMVAGLYVVALVFDWMDRRSAKRKSEIGSRTSDI